jgi:hypothetical protein
MGVLLSGGSPTPILFRLPLHCVVRRGCQQSHPKLAHSAATRSRPKDLPAPMAVLERWPARWPTSGKLRSIDAQRRRITLALAESIGKSFRGVQELAGPFAESPNFLERRLEGAPIIGLCTEWKSTGKGNGLFVRRNGIRGPAELEGRRVTTHQGRHAIHQCLLKKAYAVDSSTLKWAASPQETLIGVLRRGDADAVVLLDQLFHQGEQAEDIACLYTDGDAWNRLTAFDEMIKHIVATNGIWKRWRRYAVSWLVDGCATYQSCSRPNSSW